MNLLFLLSALLSALTGVVSGGRSAEAPQAISVGIVARQAASVAIRVAAIRPDQPLATLAAAARSAIIRVDAPRTIALYASRRRE